MDAVWLAPGSEGNHGDALGFDLSGALGAYEVFCANAKRFILVKLIRA